MKKHVETPPPTGNKVSAAQETTPDPPQALMPVTTSTIIDAGEKAKVEGVESKEKTRVSEGNGSVGAQLQWLFGHFVGSWNKELGTGDALTVHDAVTCKVGMDPVFFVLVCCVRCG